MSVITSESRHAFIVLVPKQFHEELSNSLETEFGESITIDKKSEIKEKEIIEILIVIPDDHDSYLKYISTMKLFCTDRNIELRNLD